MLRLRNDGLLFLNFYSFYIHLSLQSVPFCPSDGCRPDGIILLPNLAGKKIIECSSYTHEHMIEIGNIVTEKGGMLLEAAVSGSNIPVDTDNNLVFLCGGSRLLYNEVATDLDAMGKAKYFFGKTGAGSKARIVINMAMGTIINALGEGLQLASKFKLALNEVLEVFNDGIHVSDVLCALEGSNNLANGYGEHCFTKRQQIDMESALSLGDSVGVSLPVSVAAYKRLKCAQKSENV